MLPNRRVACLALAIALVVGDLQAQGATQAIEAQRVATSNTMFAIPLQGVTPEVDGCDALGRHTVHLTAC